MSSKSRRTHSQHAKSESSVRSVRIEHLLVLELQSLISDEASDPSLEGVTVLAAHLAPDIGEFSYLNRFAARSLVLRGYRTALRTLTDHKERGIFESILAAERRPN